MSLHMHVIHMLQRGAPHARQVVVRPNPLRGVLASELTCTVCGSRSSRNHVSFENLSVPLTHHDARMCTLQECLAAFHAPETVEGVNCDQCGLVQHALALYHTSPRGDEDQATLGALLHQLSPTARLLFCRSAKMDEAAFLANVGAGAVAVSVPPVLRHFTKQMSLVRLPNTLCIHINRYVCMWLGLSV